MTEVPPLQALAYSSENNILTRLTARAALRMLTFLRALAQADHDTFVVLQDIGRLSSFTRQSKPRAV